MCCVLGGRCQSFDMLCGRYGAQRSGKIARLCYPALLEPTFNTKAFNATNEWGSHVEHNCNCNGESFHEQPHRFGTLKPVTIVKMCRTACAVIDTNVVASALLKSESVLGRVLAHALPVLQPSAAFRSPPRAASTSESCA